MRWMSPVRPTIPAAPCSSAAGGRPPDGRTPDGRTPDGGTTTPDDGTDGTDGTTPGPGGGPSSPDHPIDRRCGGPSEGGRGSADRCSGG
ncbi:hypothetical protein GCM10020369_60390 [Cryptosporangium minutisporangium]|uniref:Uncharacterized protein n=1 Tax=Cryptosporangium minutisporangium TaxID=113569 RepID=A0ABP6T5K7_9ACTN